MMQNDDDDNDDDDNYKMWEINNASLIDQKARLTAAITNVDELAARQQVFCS